jgi:hypothetical protein
MALWLTLYVQMNRNHRSICTTLSVENFPVGGSTVKSFPVKTLSTRDQNGKISTDKVFKFASIQIMPHLFHKFGKIIDF